MILISLGWKDVIVVLALNISFQRTDPHEGEEGYCNASVFCPTPLLSSCRISGNLTSHPRLSPKWKFPKCFSTAKIDPAQHDHWNSFAKFLMTCSVHLLIARWWGYILWRGSIMMNLGERRSRSHPCQRVDVRRQCSGHYYTDSSHRLAHDWYDFIPEFISRSHARCLCTQMA